MKHCAKCDTDKPLSEFYDCPDSSDGKRGTCKKCRIAFAADYSKTPKAKTAAKKRYRRDRVKIIQNTKTWRAVNPERAKKHRDDYFRSVSGRARQIWLKARRRHKGSRDTFVSFERGLAAIEKGVCEQTGVSFEFAPHPIYSRHMFGPSIDKIDPKGDYTEDNVTVVCNMYNFGKNQYTHEEFLQFCRVFVAHSDGASHP